jgi:arginine repressor
MIAYSDFMSIMFEPKYGCPLCGDRLVKYYNTNEKTVITLNGKLVCWERVLKCRNKKCAGNSMSFHSAEFKELTLPGMSFGIDVLAHEGELRFEEHKTIDEIVDDLQECGVHLTGAAVSKHLDKYLALISGYQKEKSEEIRKKLTQQGGYVLQIDGTVSVKTKTLYIFRDNISGTILYAALARDDTDDVKPLVQYVSDTFGKPLAVVSDMQDSIIESVREVFPGIPHQYCQYHFLKNVGNAILQEKHQELGTMIRKKGVKKEIEKIQRDVEDKKKDKIDEIIFSFCCLLLGVTTMPAPFGLYYVEIFERYWHVRTGIRKCIKLGDVNSEHMRTLVRLDNLISSVF